MAVKAPRRKRDLIQRTQIHDDDILYGPILDRIALQSDGSIISL